LDEDCCSLDEITEKIDKEKLWILNTRDVEREKEYDYIINSIEGFNRTNKTIMIIAFSGEGEIARRLGDEREEMLLYLDTKETDKYYTEEYTLALENFITIF
jgi:hypothetical protein